MGSVTPTLPTKDQWTTYNYELGTDRITNANEGKYDFLPIRSLDCPNMPFIINFSEQIEYMQTHKTRISAKLWITGPSGFSKKLNLLPKEKTIEFAKVSIEKWGKEYAEKVLSATESGSVYFHILHYYGSFNNFLHEIENSEPQENKKKNASNEEIRAPEPKRKREKTSEEA